MNELLPPTDLQGRLIEKGQVLAFAILYGDKAVICLGEVILVEPTPARRNVRFHDPRPLQVRVMRPDNAAMFGKGTPDPKRDHPRNLTWVERPDRSIILPLSPQQFWEQYT